MVHAARAELGAHPFCGGQTKVRNGKAQTVVEAENVLRLQVAVVDVERVAVLNCVEQLKEHILDELVIAEVSAIMENLSEEIAVRAVVHDNPSEMRVFDNAIKGHNAGMCRSELVKGDLADVQLPLASCVALC